MENTQKKEELNLQQIFSNLKIKRYFVIKVVFVAFVIGVLAALFMRKEYEASCLVVPQVSEDFELGGTLGGLAAMAGVDIGSTGNGSIPIELYQNIFNNVNFRKELLQTKITLSKFPENVTLKEYCLSPAYKRFLWYHKLKANTIGLISTMQRKKRLEERKAMMEKANQGEKTLTYIGMTEAEYAAVYALGNIVSIAPILETYSVNISAKMPEPVAAAQVASAVEQLLQKYIIEFKTQKAKENLEFIQERFVEAEANYQEKRERLARFQDANKSLNSAVAQVRKTKLEEESTAAFEVYVSLTQQLEQARISVKENTPVFMVLEPVAIPMEPVGMGRSMIVLIFIFLGFTFSLLLIVFKQSILEIYPNEKLINWYEKEDRFFFSRKKE
jgi:uncharacterized protein involved in exopolysaccharide biosynthesis